MSECNKCKSQMVIAEICSICFLNKIKSRDNEIEKYKQHLKSIIFVSYGQDLDDIASILEVPKRLKSETDIDFRKKVLHQLFGRNTK